VFIQHHTIGAAPLGQRAPRIPHLTTMALVHVGGEVERELDASCTCIGKAIFPQSVPLVLVPIDRTIAPVRYSMVCNSGYFDHFCRQSVLRSYVP